MAESSFDVVGRQDSFSTEGRGGSSRPQQVTLDSITKNQSNRCLATNSASSGGTGATGATPTSFVAFHSQMRSSEIRSVKRKVHKFMNGQLVEFGLGAVILFNFALIIIDTDQRTSGNEGEVSSLITIMDAVCFTIFAVELAIRLYTDPDRRSFFSKVWNALDGVIVVVGCVDYFVRLVVGLRVDAVRAVRMVRLLRLLRVLRLFRMLKELRRLIEMMGGCFKTLFWSCLLLLTIMTLWAVVAVDLLSDYVEEIAEEGGWRDCDRCRRSFSSVFDADVTLFQTVVAGDSWGAVAVPIIERHPWTAVIFVGSLMTLVFGVLNLIVAVIVDVFAESREKDFANKADELLREEAEQKRVLGNIFENIDKDCSGALSYEELVEGAHKVPEFARWLRVMDIDSRDLYQLFRIVDEDGSGEINSHEFIDAMYRMKTADSKTATKFVKHIVTRLDQEHSEFKAAMGSTMLEVVSKVNEMNTNFEGHVQNSLFFHESRLREAIGDALRQASEVALQFASEAATCTTAGGPGNAGFAIGAFAVERSPGISVSSRRRASHPAAD